MKFLTAAVRITILAAICVISVGIGAAQTSDIAPASNSVEQTILQKDSAFWLAYNTCDVAAMQAYFKEGLEFYHDNGGLTAGREELLSSVRTGICRPDGQRLRRVAIDSTIRVFPMANDGALISGEHVFYVTEPGKTEYLDGQAKFFHYWHFRDGEWKMSRVFSYDHGPAVVGPSTAKIQLSPKQLLHYVGTYNSSISGDAVVSVVGESLNLSSGGFSSNVDALAEDKFYAARGAITFTFNRDPSGEVVTLAISQDNKIVDEATKLK